MSALKAEQMKRKPQKTEEIHSFIHSRIHSFSWREEVDQSLFSRMRDVLKKVQCWMEPRRDKESGSPVFPSIGCREAEKGEEAGRKGTGKRDQVQRHQRMVCLIPSSAFFQTSL